MSSPEELFQRLAERAVSGRVVVLWKDERWRVQAQLGSGRRLRSAWHGTVSAAVLDAVQTMDRWDSSADEVK